MWKNDCLSGTGRILNHKNRGCIAAIALLAAFMNLSAQEDYSKWSDSCKIFLNTSASGANISSALAKVPVLIRLNPGVFWGSYNTRPGGVDIRFSTSAGKHLPYHIERWVDNAQDNDTAWVWVLADAITGNSSTQYIKMYWGKSDAADSSKSIAVFDTSNGFQAVWHLGEPGGTKVLDATPNKYDGTPTGMTAASMVPGVIGMAQQFNGTSNFIDSLGPAGGKLNFPENGTYTVSAWVSPNAVNTVNHDIVCKGDHQYSMQLFGGDWRFSEFKNNAGWDYVNSAAAGAAGVWKHVTGVRSGAKMALYVDGVLADSTITAFAAAVPRNTAAAVQVGHNPESGMFWDGKIDEVTISSSARSADWIKFLYENQKTNSSVVSMVSCDGAKPKFSVSPPQQIKAGVGDTVTLSATATGTPPFTFTWFKNGTVKQTGQSLRYTTTYTIRPVQAADTGTYWVVAGNGSGTDSSTKTLFIVNTRPVNAHVQPTSLIVRMNGTATIYVAATSTIQITGYKWFKGSTYLPSEYNYALNIGPVTQADAAKYWAIVSNAVGSDTSDTATLTVTARAQFSVSQLIGKVPDTVQFTDSSLGTIAKRIWYFDDGVVDSTSLNPVHIYGNAGSFNAKLVVVEGTKRTDSMTVTIRSYIDNPIVLSGKYAGSPNAGSQSVELTFSNVAAIDSSLADSVGLWYKAGGYPSAPASSTQLKPYSLASLRSKGAKALEYVSVPSITPPDTVYGFMTEVHWLNGKKSAFTLANGALVLMKDTTKPENRCVIDGQYLDADSSLITVSNMQNIDTSVIDSFFIWNGSTPGENTPDFSDTAASKGYSLKQRFPKILVESGRDNIVVKNAAFNSGKQFRVYCAVALKGINHILSQPVISPYLVGNNRPVNPILLTAVPKGTTKIMLKWNPVFNMSQIRIWYRTGTPVPPDYQFDETKFFNVEVAAGTDSVLITDLNDGTMYFFGAQVFDGSYWSFVTTNSSANVSTSIASLVLDSNTVKVTGLNFDSETHELKVSWSVNRIVAKNPEDTLQVGITYNIGVSYPDPDAVIRQTELVRADTGSAFVKLWEPIEFNTTYSLSLSLRNITGKWSPPTSNSRKQTTSPNFNWQPVSFFLKQPDTSMGFNGIIRLMTDSTGAQVQAVKDTVRIFPDSLVQTTGFVPACSTMFYFSAAATRTSPPPPFHVGMKIDKIISSDPLYGSVRIYRWDIVARAWVVESGCQIDAQGYVSVKTSALVNPFAAMVDVQHVRVDLPPTAGQPLDTQQMTVDSFTISDNVANVSWRYLCARGGDPLSSGSSSQGVLSQKSGIIHDTILASYATADNGVRALLVVSDGVNTDTVNVSRQVRRNGIDTAKIAVKEENTWVPLKVTAALDSPLVRQVMNSIAPVGKAWTYDNSQVRIFRWFPNELNKANPVKWIEYSDNTDVFSFQPGVLIWIKSKNPLDIRFGSGKSTPLWPDTVELWPNTWTDLAIPFQFPMYVGDIISETRSKYAQADSLEVYLWSKDTASGMYGTVAKHISAFKGTSLSQDTTLMTSDNKTGYAVFNPTSERIVLRIPAVPTGMSKAAVLTKKTSEKGWAVRIDPVLEGGSRLSPVYCGFAPSKGGAVRYFALAPSFSNVYAAVCDKPSKSLYGHALMQSMPDGGCAYLLAFCNGSETSRKIAYRLQVEGELEKGMKAVVFDEGTGQFEASSGQGSVAVASGGREYRWLFVGNEAYLSKAAVLVHSVKLDLLGVYANGYGRSMRIRYSVPGDGVSRIQFELYDVSGRLVWQTGRDCRTVSGVKELVWDGKTTGGKAVACGIYVLRMVSFDARQSPFAVFERKMTFMP
jgi:PKD repeat protein